MPATKLHLLIITGLDAAKELDHIDLSIVRKKFDLTIEVAQIGTIAFLSPSQLQAILSKYEKQSVDLVLVSGLIPWDVSKLEGPLASKIRKGPKFLATLPEILLHCDLNRLSAVFPADKVYTEIKIAQFTKIIDEQREICQKKPKSCIILSEKHSLIRFSPNLPPILIAEIVDAPQYPFEALCGKIDYYLREGAEIIDLGCIANQDYSEWIRENLPKLTRQFPVPFAIDSMNPKEIWTAVEEGAELVLSINPDNIDHLLDLPKDLALVVVPVSFQTPPIAKRTPEEKVIILLDLEARLRSAGFQKLFLDPITDSPIYPGIWPSFETLSQLNRIRISHGDRNDQKSLCETQLFMGAENVTELMDADSPGINAFLAVIVAELGISAVLSCEASNKTRKSIKELKQSLLLTYYAKELHVPPINLGFSALRLKSKHKYPIYLTYGEKIESVETKESLADMDPGGYFKIGVNLEKNHIFITHFNNQPEKQEATCTYIGTTAESLYKQIIAEKKVTRLDHAAYLGKELMRAEFALKFGTEYVED